MGSDKFGGSRFLEPENAFVWKTIIYFLFGEGFVGRSYMLL